MIVAADQLYWDSRYLDGHGSGYGSYNDSMLRKVKLLSKLKGIRTITEIGCGDFNFGNNLLKKFPHASYIGSDISAAIIERNKSLHSQPNVSFHHCGEPVAPRDLLLCVDVLFHVSDDVEYQALLDLLKRHWYRHLALTAYEYDGLRQGHVHIRKFDPAFFGRPIVREVIESDGSMYFYIFERLP